MYSREYLGFLPLAVLPIVLGTALISAALLWPR